MFKTVNWLDRRRGSHWQADIVHDEGNANVITRRQSRKQEEPKRDTTRTVSHVDEPTSDGSNRLSDGALGQTDRLHSPCDAVDGQRDEARQDPPKEVVKNQSHDALAAPFALSAGSNEVNWSSEELVSLQRSDETLGTVIGRLEKQIKPMWEELLSQSSELRAYWLNWESLEPRHGLVYHPWKVSVNISSWQ